MSAWGRRRESAGALDGHTDEGHVGSRNRQGNCSWAGALHGPCSRGEQARGQPGAMGVGARAMQKTQSNLGRCRGLVQRADSLSAVPCPLVLGLCLVVTWGVGEAYVGAPWR